MERKNIIIITEDGTPIETWGSLTEICEVWGWSYNYLKRKKFPFKFRGYWLHKLPFRKPDVNFKLLTN